MCLLRVCLVKNTFGQRSQYLLVLQWAVSKWIFKFSRQCSFLSQKQQVCGSVTRNPSLPILESISTVLLYLVFCIGWHSNDGLAFVSLIFNFSTSTIGSEKLKKNVERFRFKILFNLSTYIFAFDLKISSPLILLCWQASVVAFMIVWLTCKNNF